MKPKVIVNCAMSADGKIALPDRSEIKISGEEDFERVHRLRNSVDAIVVGIGTVLADDPKLTVKSKYVDDPKKPLKVILDSDGRTPESAQLFNKGEYLIVTTEDIDKDSWIKCGENRVDLNQLMEVLSDKGIENVLVEGGGEVIYSFLKEGFVDEMSIYIGSLIIGGREAPTPADGEGAGDITDTIGLKLESYERMDEGILLRYKVGLG